MVVYQRNGEFDLLDTMLIMGISFIKQGTAS